MKLKPSILIDKKATDKIISVYWFAILFIVSGAIIYMTAIFYGASYDIRNLEADILSSKVADCISENGKIKGNLVKDGNFALSEDNFLNLCKLNFNTEDTWNEIQYFTEVMIYFPQDTNVPIFTLDSGNKNFATLCDLQDNNDNKLVECSEKRFYFVGINPEEQYLIKIISAVRKTEKNA